MRLRPVRSIWRTCRSNYVALRGRLEAEHFSGHGVARERLDVTGNPSVSATPPPARLDSQALPVLAVSPNLTEVTSIVELVQTVSSARWSRHTPAPIAMR